jgi:amidase
VVAPTGWLQSPGMRHIGRARASAGAVAAGALIATTGVTGAAADPPRFRVEEASVASIRTAIAAGTTSCSEVVAAALDRIAAYDDAGPRLNAVLAVNEDALSTAAALDEQYAEGGFVGPLHCVPVLLKDNYDTADLPTTAASAALEGAQPPDDATTVARLRAAGAIVIGKANLHEFAVTGVTASSLGGQTLNPYDLTRTPGGSSGGTGAGVAAGFAVVGTGTDTVNSIRSPSSANGLVGLRPTRGLVSRDGIVPVSSTQDAAGPIARSVADAAAVLQVMAGHDPADPATDVLVDRELPDYVAAAGRRVLPGARIGVVTDFLLAGELYEPVNAVVEQARADLTAQGATVVDVDLGATAAELSATYDVQRFEFEPLLEAYLATTDAPVRTLEEIRALDRLHPTVESFLAAADETGDGRTSADYAQRLAGIAEFRDRVLALMDAQDLDLLFYPMQSRLVEPVVEQMQRDRNGILAALTGFPALTVPGGFTAPTADAPLGVPVGVEFFARPFDEPLLLAAGRGFEEATGHRRPPVSTPPL